MVIHIDHQYIAQHYDTYVDGTYVTTFSVMKIYMPTSTQCTVEAVTVTSIKTDIHQTCKLAKTL